MRKPSADHRSEPVVNEAEHCWNSLPQDCNLVMYTGAGNAPSNAIYASGTYDKGTLPCTLTVSGVGGGFIAVTDSTFHVLYVQPPSFEVLLDGGYTATAPYLNQYQIYDVNSGSAFQTTNSPTLLQTTGRTLLPGNTILAYGQNSSNGGGAEVYNPRTSTWTQTAPPSTDREFEGLITLFDGTALAVGGESAPYGTSLATCEIFSPSTNAWTLTAPMSTPRDEVCC